TQGRKGETAHREVSWSGRNWAGFCCEVPSLALADGDSQQLSYIAGLIPARSPHSAELPDGRPETYRTATTPPVQITGELYMQDQLTGILHWVEQADSTCPGAPTGGYTPSCTSMISSATSPWA